MLKTCASIQSFCCYTKVGLALAFPTLEAMGVECAPVPSCLLSTEVPGYGDFYIRSCTDDMKATFTHWNRENLKWDSIYTGFLSDPKQIDVIIDFVKTHPESLIMIDPAFADDCRSLLTLMMSECSREFEQLPILLHAEILRNVLYSGVWSRYTAVTSERLAGKNTHNAADTADGNSTAGRTTNDNPHPDTDNSTTGDQEQ